MASFTDQPYKFNPYISTQPVDAMVKVGMYKQEQYDTNVQKIQSWMDSTAALPVSRDVDKQYLQSALNSAGEEINKLGNADFAEQQLTNSIGGMVGKISKDPVIIAGVQSTMNMQKQAALREQYLKEGKTSPSNDYDYDLAASDYLNSTELGRVFKHTYTPYTDVNKKFMEVLKSIHPDARVQDIPFETTTDANGNIVPNYGKIARVMMEQNIEGISKEKIENALRASLTPLEMNQLRLDANYTLRGATPEVLAATAKSNYTANVKRTEEALKSAEEELLAARNDTAKSRRLQSVIDGYKRLLGKDGKPSILEENYKEELAYVQANPEQARLNIYKNGAIAQFASAFSWEKKSLKYTDSPFEKVKQWDKKYALDVQGFNLEVAKFGETKEQNRINNAFKAKELELKELEAMGLGGPGGFTSVVGANAKDLPSAFEAMSNEATAQVQRADALATQLKKQLGVKTDAELEAKITEYQTGGPNGAGNLGAIPVDARAAAEDYINTVNKAARIQAVIERESKRAEADVKKSAPKLEELLANRNNLSFTTPDGQRVTYTAKEVYDFMQKKPERSIAEGTFYASEGVIPLSVDNKIDLNKLTPKEKVLYNKFQGFLTGKPKGADDNLFRSYVKDFNPVKEQESKTKVAISQKTAEYLSPYANAWIPVKEVIPTIDSKTRSTMEAIATATLTAGIADEGNAVYGAGREKLQGWLTGKSKDNLTYEHVQQGSSNELWVSDGTDIARVKLSPELARQMPSKLRMAQSTLDLQEALNTLGGTTAVDPSPRGAYFQSKAFKNLRTVQAVANVDKNSYGESYLSLQIRVPNSPDGWIRVQLQKPLNLVGVQNYISNIDDKGLIQEAIKSIQLSTNDTEAINYLQQMLK